MLWTFCVLALLIAAALAWLHSPFAHRWVSEKLTASLSEALGREVRLAGVDYGLWPLWLEVRDLEVAGAAAEEPSFLTAESLWIEATVEGLRRPLVRLETVQALHPRLDLRLREDGSTNLPVLAQGQGDGRITGLDLGLLVVEGGEVTWNDRTLPLWLQAREVRARSSGDTESGFEARAEASEVALTLPGDRDWSGAVALRARFGAGQLELTEGLLRGPHLRLGARGSMSWDEGGARGRLELEGQGEAALAQSLGYLEEPIAGPWQASGALVWGRSGEEREKEEAEPSWRLALEVTSPEIELRELDIRQIQGQVESRPAATRVELHQATYAGGQVRGSLHLDVSGEEVVGTLKGTFADARLEAVARDLQLPAEAAPVAGRVDGELSYRFSAADVWAGEGEGVVRLRRARGGERWLPAGEGLPVSGELPLRMRAGVLELRRGRLEAPGQSLTGEARYDFGHGQAAASWQLRSEDLGPLALQLLPSDGAAVGGDTLSRFIPTRGRGQMEGRLVWQRGGEARAEVDLALADLAAPALSLDELRGSFQWSPEGLEGLRLDGGSGESSATLTGAISWTERSSMRLEGELKHWPLASLSAALAADGEEAALPMDGRLEARVWLEGPLEKPRVRVEAQGSPVSLAGFELSEVRAAGTLAEGIVELETFEALAPAGEVRLGGHFGIAGESLDLTLSSSRLDLGREPFASYLGGGLGGALEVEGRLEGSIDQPRSSATVRASDLTMGSKPLGDQGAAVVRLAWEGDRLEASGSVLGLMDLSGGGVLRLDEADLDFAVESQNLAGLYGLAAAEPLPGLEGELAGSLSIQGDVRNPEALAVELELPHLVLRRDGREIHSLEPVVLALDGHRLVLRSLFMGEEASGSELFVLGSVDLGQDDPGLDLRVQTSLAAVWAELLIPGVELDGIFEAIATVKGSLASPAINGQGEMRQGRLILERFPHALEKVHGTVLFYPESVVLDTLQGELAGGTVRLSGRLGLPSADRGMEYRLQGSGDNLTVRYPEGWILRGDAQLSLLSNPEGGRTLSGTVELDRAFYLEDLTTGVTVFAQRFFQRERLEVQETDEELAATQLNLSVRGRDALRVSNNVADIRGDADFSLRGNLARPVVFGQVEVEPGGTIRYLDNTYRVERGLLTFSNPYRIEPVIDLSASTRVRDYEVELNLSGTLDRLNATYRSDPPLADLEVLSLVATGSPEVIGSGTGSSMAESFLFGQAASAISKRVGSLFGLDTFRIDPVGGGGGSVSAVRVTVEKRLSKSFVVSFSQDPSSTENQILQARWAVQDNLTLVFTLEGDETYAVDVRWDKAF